MSANVDPYAVPTADQLAAEWLGEVVAADIERRREEAEEHQAAEDKRLAKLAHLQRIASLGGQRKGRLHGKMNRNGDRRRPKRSPDSPWAAAGFEPSDAGRKAWREAGKPEPGRSPVGHQPYVSGIDFALKQHPEEGA